MNSPKGVEVPCGPLQVSDFDGMSGAGKTTIITHLADVLPQIPNIGMSRVVIEATGIYYRALAAEFIKEGSVRPGASEENVRGLEEYISSEEIGHIIGSGQDTLTKRYGRGTLKSPAVNSIVSYLPRIEVIRSGVRGAFQSRLQTLADLPPDHPDRPSLVLADGRNIRPLVHGVTGAKLLLSHFITCADVAAAAREYRVRAARGELIDVAGAMKMLATIQKRNYADAANPHNPGKPDEDALLLAPTKDEIPHERVIIGMGIEAAIKHTQIHFDTTYLKMPNMLKAARLLIVGAWAGQDPNNRLNSAKH